MMSATATHGSSQTTDDAGAATAGSRGRTLVLLAALAIAGTAAWGLYRVWNGPASPSQAAGGWEIPAEFDADRAYGYLETIVGFGPRPSGSEGMQQQQEFLREFFTEAGAEVELQKFDTRHPQHGDRVVLANLIARFRPAAPQRYLLCAHYDTRPFPDQDPEDPRGVFVGANDGGSGTAALMEMSHHIEKLPEHIGVDIVLFDGEELVYESERDPYFLGSTYFARHYADQQRRGAIRHPYVAGVLLDMVGDRELQLYYERNSWNYAREVTVEIWSTARRLGIDAFKPRLRHVVRDDHLPLNQIAGIPTTDIIDFDYPRPGFRHQSYWHTREDTLDKTSGRSLVAVVYVVHSWLATK